MLTSIEFIKECGYEFYQRYLGNGWRGIGLALVEKAKTEKIGVTLFSRPDVDLTRLDDIQRIFAATDQLPSVIVNTIGMLYKDQHLPEKSLIDFQADWFY